MVSNSAQCDNKVSFFKVSDNLTSTKELNTKNNNLESKNKENQKSLNVAKCNELNKIKSNITSKGIVRRLSQFKKPMSSQISTSEARITKTLGIIMGVFVVCWLPFFLIYNIRSQLEDPDSISGNTMEFFLWLGYFNSALNPILYAILNANFRNAFREILACQCFFSKTHNRFFLFYLA